MKRAKKPGTGVLVRDCVGSLCWSARSCSLVIEPYIAKRCVVILFSLFKAAYGWTSEGSDFFPGKGVENLQGGSRKKQEERQRGCEGTLDATKQNGGAERK